MSRSSKRAKARVASDCRPFGGAIPSFAAEMGLHDWSSFRNAHLVGPAICCGGESPSRWPLDSQGRLSWRGDVLRSAATVQANDPGHLCCKNVSRGLAARTEGHHGSARGHRGRELDGEQRLRVEGP